MRSWLTFRGPAGLLAAVLVLALAVPDTLAANSFNDTAGHWAAGDIRAMAEAGLASGYPDGTFRPYQPITRQEAAVILTRAFGFEGEAQARSSSEIQSILARYSDRGVIASWARAHVADLTARGTLGGYPDGTFRPGPEVAAEFWAQWTGEITLQQR